MTFRGNTVPVVYRRERAAPWGSGRAERRGAIYRGKGEGLLEGQQKRDRMGLEVEKTFWTVGLTQAKRRQQPRAAHVRDACPVPLPTSGSLTRPSWKEQELGS